MIKCYRHTTFITTLFLAIAPVHAYNKLCYEDAPFNTPFKKDEMRENRRGSDYSYTDNKGKRRCFVRLGHPVKKRVKKELGKYDSNTIITPDLIELFLNKRDRNDKIIGWILQDFTTQDGKTSTTMTVGDVLQELLID
jgi:hypothetical protein